MVGFRIKSFVSIFFVTLCFQIIFVACGRELPDDVEVPSKGRKSEGASSQLYSRRGPQKVHDSLESDESAPVPVKKTKKQGALLRGHETQPTIAAQTYSKNQKGTTYDPDFPQACRDHWILDLNPATPLEGEQFMETIKDLAEHPGWLYKTYKCSQPNGKSSCAVKCQQRETFFTGSCESGYCVCSDKWEKKFQELIGRPTSQSTSFTTDCSSDRKEQVCRKYCESLSADNSFNGLCVENKCSCVIFPIASEKRECACVQILKTLSNLEERIRNNFVSPNAKSDILSDESFPDIIERLHMLVSKPDFDLQLRNSEACSKENLAASKELLQSIVELLGMMDEHPSQDEQPEEEDEQVPQQSSHRPPNPPHSTSRKEAGLQAPPKSGSRRSKNLDSQQDNSRGRRNQGSNRRQHGSGRD